MYMNALKTDVAKLDYTYGGTSSVDNFTRTNKMRLVSENLQY